MFHRQANANNSLFKYYVCPFFYPEERRERTHFVCAWQIGLLQFNTDIIYCYVCIQICIPSYCKCRSDIQFLFVRCLNLSFFYFTWSLLTLFCCLVILDLCLFWVSVCLFRLILSVCLPVVLSTVCLSVC